MLPTLSATGLVLRPWAAGDVDVVLDLYSRWEVVRFLGASPAVMSGRAEAEARVAAWAALQGPVCGVWALVPDGRQTPVGTVLLKELPLSGTGEPSGDVEIGWHLHPDVWGSGYATRAAQLVLDHAWASGLVRVHAVTYPQNHASRAVCRRLGMAQLGLTSRYYDVECSLFRMDAPRR